MEYTRTPWPRRTTRLGLSVLTAAALATGAAWQAFAGNDAAPVLTAAAQSTQAPALARTLPEARESYADIVKLVGPAVVTIRTEARARMTPTASPDQDDLLRRFFGDQFGDPFGPFGQRGPRVEPRGPRRGGLGSGVIVSTDGYILTNHHVVDAATGIDVELTDGRTFDAKIIGSDRLSDLALLKIEATGLTALALGNSDNVQVGDVVLAVGNPLGLGQTVTMGIISATGRRTDLGDSYEDFLQTDAPINQGNSGGALVNLKGELVGINAQIASMTGGNIGIGFAIPANMARHVMEDLKADGRVRRAQLGVGVQNIDSELAASLDLKTVGGAIVTNVERGSAAERAGIRQGDVIVSYAGQPVRDVNGLRNRVAESEPGAKSEVAIVRDGSERTLTVTLDEAKSSRAAARENPAEPGDSATLGVTVAPLTPEVARRRGIAESTQGLVIENVDPDSRAASAGLRPGDVIQQVDRQPVTSVEELRAAVRKTTDRPLLLLVNREGNNLYVPVRPS